MWLIASLCFVLFSLVNAHQQRIIYEQKLSSVDNELISFGNESLAKYFHYNENLRPTHIVRIKSAVDLENSRQIFTVHFEIHSNDNDLVRQLTREILEDFCFVNIYIYIRRSTNVQSRFMMIQLDTFVLLFVRSFVFH